MLEKFQIAFTSVLLIGVIAQAIRGLFLPHSIPFAVWLPLIAVLVWGVKVSIEEYKQYKKNSYERNGRKVNREDERNTSSY